MRIATTLRFDENILNAAKARLDDEDNSRSLVTYIESLIAKDLGISYEPSIQLTNATGQNLREFKVLRVDSETDESYNLRASLFNKLLDATGY